MDTFLISLGIMTYFALKESSVVLFSCHIWFSFVGLSTNIHLFNKYLLL